MYYSKNSNGILVVTNNTEGQFSYLHYYINLARSPRSLSHWSITQNQNNSVWPLFFFLWFSLISEAMRFYTRKIYRLSVQKARRRRRRIPRRTISSICTRSCASRGPRSLKNMEAKSDLSYKLEALEKLIPPQNGEIVKAEQLFKETADYIVLLKSRVVILQKLIEYYGNSNSENQNAVL